MQSKTKKLAVLVIFGLIFPLILTLTVDLSEKHNTNIISPKVSGGHTESFIHVDGNWSSTASSNPWCYLDNGVYIIENVTIDASNSPTGSGIFIYNSVNDFVIRNCTIYNAGGGMLNAGIKLYITDNGQIYNNTCTNNGKYGILLYFHCDYNVISGNVVANSQDEGLYFSNTCNNNEVINNEVNNNSNNGISLYNKCDNNNITGNTVYENYNAGIRLHTTCNSNTISGNNAYRNKNGIEITTSNNNNISKNVATENSNNGIYLIYNSENNNITENSAEGNYRHGIELYYGSNWNNITRNTVKDNTITGIYLHSTSDNNIIKNNTINRNDLGILLSSSNFNNVSDNLLKDNNWCIFETECTGNIIINNDCTAPTINETIFIDGAATGVGAKNWTWAQAQTWCSGLGTMEVPYVIENLKISGFGIQNGIEIRNSEVFFIIQECQIYNSLSGIYLDNVNNSRLTENNCSNNAYGGIWLDEGCSNNEIIKNVASYNRDYGVSIGDLCDYNTISQNTVCYNIDTGIILSGGGFDSSYYNNFTGNVVNNNTYGINFVEACHFSTISGNIISGNNIGIFFEDFLCSNNSVYNNFFLTNGKHAVDDGEDNKWNSTTIGNYWDNHTGPDANNDGIVDIPYTYIGGSAQSIDYLPIAEDVSGTPSGLPPGVTAIIIVVSVAGGLGLIGAAYIFLKKRRA